MACNNPNVPAVTPIPSNIINLAGLDDGICVQPIAPGSPGDVIQVAPDGRHFQWAATHPPAHLETAAQPFEWDDDTQCGIVPLPGQFVNNGNGQFVFTPGDGSAITNLVLPWLQDNGDGSYTFAPGSTGRPNFDFNAGTLIDNGAVNGVRTFTFVPTGVSFQVHNAAILTTGYGEFSWHQAGQAGFIPRSSYLVDNGNGTYTLFDGEGRPPVTFSGGMPAGVLIDNGNGTYTWTPPSGAPFTFSGGSASGNLVDNGDGTYTWTPSAGAPFTFSTAKEKFSQHVPINQPLNLTPVFSQDNIASGFSQIVASGSVSIINPSLDYAMDCTVFLQGYCNIYFRPDSGSANVGGNCITTVNVGAGDIITGVITLNESYGTNRIGGAELILPYTFVVPAGGSIAMSWKSTANVNSGGTTSRLQVWSPVGVVICNNQ